MNCELWGIFSGLKDAEKLGCITFKSPLQQKVLCINHFLLYYLHHYHSINKYFSFMMEKKVSFVVSFTFPEKKKKKLYREKLVFTSLSNIYTWENTVYFRNEGQNINSFSRILFLCFWCWFVSFSSFLPCSPTLFFQILLLNSSSCDFF